MDKLTEAQKAREKFNVGDSVTHIPTQANGFVRGWDCEAPEDTPVLVLEVGPESFMLAQADEFRFTY